MNREEAKFVQEDGHPYMEDVQKALDAFKK